MARMCRIVELIDGKWVAGEPTTSTACLEAVKALPHDNWRIEYYERYLGWGE